MQPIFCNNNQQFTRKKEAASGRGAASFIRYWLGCGGLGTFGVLLTLRHFTATLWAFEPAFTM